MSKRTKFVLDGLSQDCTDAYLISLYKKNKNLNKKLKEIDELNSKPKDSLKPTQVDKISKKRDTIQQKEELDEKAREYQKAVKDVLQSNDKTETFAPSKKQQKEQQPDQQEQQQQQQENEQSETIENHFQYQRIVDLLYAGLYLINAEHQGQDAVCKFYRKVFQHENGTYGDNLQLAYSEIQKFLDASHEEALEETSYAEIFNEVHDLVESQAFTNKGFSAKKHTSNNRQHKKRSEEVVREQVQEQPKAQEEPIQQQPKQEEPVVEQTEQQPEVQQEKEQAPQEAQQERPRRNENNRDNRGGNRQGNRGGNRNNYRKKSGEQAQQQQPEGQQEQEDDEWTKVKAPLVKKPQQYGGQRKNYNNNRDQNRDQNKDQNRDQNRDQDGDQNRENKGYNRRNNNNNNGENRGQRREGEEGGRRYNNNNNNNGRRYDNNRGEKRQNNRSQYVQKDQVEQENTEQQ